MSTTCTTILPNGTPCPGIPLPRFNVCYDCWHLRNTKPTAPAADSARCVWCTLPRAEHTAGRVDHAFEERAPALRRDVAGVFVEAAE